jgi:hypothetical protein
MSKLPAKHTPIVLSAVMAVLMAGFMSAVLTAINLGVDAHFIGRWLNAYIKVLPIAFVAIMIFRPIAMKITALLVDAPR